MQSESKELKIDEKPIPFLHPKVKQKDFKNNNLLNPIQIAAVKEWFMKNPGKLLCPAGTPGVGPYPVAKARFSESYYAIYETERVGKGAFGSVYTGFDIDAEQWVAIKAQDIETQAKEHKVDKGQVRDGALHEVNMLNLAKGRGTAHLLEAMYRGKSRIERSTIFTIMPLEHGLDGEYLIKNRFFSAQKRLKIAINFLKGLQQIHNLNILHRDIKLANVIINPSTGRVSIIDFNIAREMKNAEYKGGLAGTPGYIPVEMSEKKVNVFNAHTDLYSAGFALAELFGMKGLKMNDEDEPTSEFFIDNSPHIDITGQLQTDLQTLLRKLTDRNPLKNDDNCRRNNKFGNPTRILP